MINKIKNQIYLENKGEGNRGKTLIEWDFFEFNLHQRSKLWYVWLGVISAGFLAYSFFTFNFLFAIFIVLADIVFISGIINNPDKIKFSIKEDGIETGKNFYNFKDLKKFWLIYDPPKTKKLYFEFTNGFKPILVIPLEKQNPIEIRKILKERLEENLGQEKESVSEQFEKLLKL